MFKRFVKAINIFKRLIILQNWKIINLKFIINLPDVQKQT